MYTFLEYRSKMPGGEQSFGKETAKGSSFNKVIAPGFSDHDKQVILGDLAESFQNPPEVENELEKTPSEKQIIEMANLLTSQVVMSLGLKPLEIPLENVKVLPAVSISDKDFGGQMDPRRQVLELERTPYNLVTFKRAIHEMLHAKSFGALQTLADESSAIDFTARCGFGITSRDGSKRYFWRLTEAVTETLNKKAMKYALRTNPEIFAQEMADTNEVKSQSGEFDHTGGGRVNKDDIYFARFPKGAEEQFVGFSHVYKTERDAFDTLVDKIYQNQKAAFETPGDVSEEFYKAYFSGKILTVATIVDKTFGKGTFRKIGEAQTAEEFNALIEAL